jgi:hypothetical protein
MEKNGNEISINYRSLFFRRFKNYLLRNLPYGCFFILWMIGNKTGQFITYKYILKSNK